MVVIPKKSLGQHWLADEHAINQIVKLASLNDKDTVLEIGPGTGNLTEKLLGQAGRVIAVEIDTYLANKLKEQYRSSKLEVINDDFLSLNLSLIPKGYKVVANVPYYITSKIIRSLMTATNKPSLCILLVQKEVAQRLVASPGKLSILAISAQVYSEVVLGPIVKASLFIPAPKVDSQVVVLKTLPTPRVEDEKAFFRVVKAGFSSPRKKLRSSLAAGLAISKELSEQYLNQAGIDPNLRAEQLDIDDWLRLSQFVGT